jgi:hypothetical protein
MDEFVSDENVFFRVRYCPKEGLTVKDLMSATVLHRGLGSGYPAPGSVYRNEGLTRRGSLTDIAADFVLVKIAASRITRRKSRQFT